MSPGPTERVRALALEAGFELVGFARAEPIDPAFFDAWLGAGYHGEMAYMASGRDARLDPTALLPSARSVISLALNYWQPGSPELPGGGKISRYAWGRDYHKVLGGRLRALRRGLEAHFPGVESWGGSDAVPILEKVWAQRAGLGWIGKNGNLITRQYGSWVFLATLLTSLELEPDAPHPDRCGRCEACLPACPTGAIVSPQVVDARRCLSYLTIEHRGPWPEAHEGESAGWLFGCDLCQEVCPWSQRFATQSATPDFSPRPEILGEGAGSWAAADPGRWDARTQGSAMRRAGPEQLARNAEQVRRALARAESARDEGPT